MGNPGLLIAVAVAVTIGPTVAADVAVAPAVGVLVRDGTGVEGAILVPVAAGATAVTVGLPAFHTGTGAVGDGADTVGTAGEPA